MSRRERPVDEGERVKVVRSLGLLDTRPEDRFDRIARVAAALYDVPIAFLSLMDSERQWMQSCLGIPRADHVRDDTICATTLLQDGPLIVNDLREDSRFRDLPGVAADGGVRFYAGHPLHVQGQVVGTLCVVDLEPRSLTATQLARLPDLARWAEEELGAVELAEALTHERETAQALQVLQQRDELVLAAAETGVLVTDAVGRVTLVNPAATRMLGCAGVDLLDQDLHQALHERAHDTARSDPPSHAREACPLHRALAEGVPQRVLADALYRPDGERLDVTYAAAPLIVDGKVTGCVLTVDDITRRCAVERLKDEFVSVVSHELRTPLTSIRGSLGLLSSGQLGAVPTSAARMLEIAVTNTDRLIRLVNDILDLERIESGAVDVDLRVQPLHPLLEAARHAVAGMAVDAGVSVVVRQTGIEAAVDADLLVQALTNLLANAVKFSPTGAVVLMSARERDGEVLLDVIDEGRGIPGERLERIFERFEQVDASDAREKGGTGLGLAITRSIASRLGGRVTVASTLGNGSTFTVAVPAVGREGNGRPVVLVEDDADLLEVLTRALRGLGLDVVPARTEDQAVALATRLRPRLLMLDVELAEGSGFGVAQRLREDAELGAIPCVVATVHDLDETARQRLTLGPTRFVRKGRGDEDVVKVMVDAALALQEADA
jgi:PAS domain S-box-containing protein